MSSRLSEVMRLRRKHPSAGATAPRKATVHVATTQVREERFPPQSAISDAKPQGCAREQWLLLAYSTIILGVQFAIWRRRTSSLADLLLLLSSILLFCACACVAALDKLRLLPMCVKVHMVVHICAHVINHAYALFN